MEVKNLKRTAGANLRRIRRRLGLSLREVAELSRLVAAQQADDDYLVSHPRLVHIENAKSTPSIFKLFTLSTIYGVPISTLLAAYIDSELADSLHLSMPLPHTRLSSDGDDESGEAGIATALSAETPPNDTRLLPDWANSLGKLPAFLAATPSARRHLYAAIGLADYRMFPLLRPGSLVQIDETDKVVPPVQYRSEYERPIYLVEIRSGYLCSWCETRNGRLYSIPHPLSSCPIQDFMYPSEAEIVGRVTGVALRLDSARSATARPEHQSEGERTGMPDRAKRCRVLSASAV